MVLVNWPASDHRERDRQYLLSDVELDSVDEGVIVNRSGVGGPSSK
jgi:hypothetical protein